MKNITGGVHLKRKLLLSFIFFFTYNFICIQNASYAEMDLKSETIQEVEELRTQNTKVYHDSSNDKYIEKIFSNSVHYKDKEGEWQDINNTILPILQKNDQYTNYVGKNNYLLSLNKRSDKAIKISYKDMFIKYIALNTNKKEAMVNNNEIMFKNAWKSTDLQYVVQNDGIKMNIYLKDKMAPKTIQFEIVTSDLKLNKESDGFSFSDKQNNEKIFTLPKMWVSDQSDPSKLRYDRIKEKIINKDGKTVLSVSLNDENLTYPLVIDPTTYLDSYGKFTDSTPGDLVAENLVTPLQSGAIEEIQVSADYVDPIHGPQGEVPVELYANRNKIPQTIVCYASCTAPTQNASLGAVKISNYGQKSINSTQINTALGKNFMINGITIYGSWIGHYSITITYENGKPREPLNVKVERFNDKQLKISWNITQANKLYRIRDLFNNNLLAETDKNFAIINLAMSGSYYIVTYSPFLNLESDKVRFDYDASNKITYFYINNRLDRVTNQTKNETIKYEYDANGNLLRRYKI
ncbi:hypothetical protein AMQ84_15940 [Paenibacillus riograndensis]|uniref:Uncharacterized protein n=1 Tax=Paenibacillus riograndensis TaxID=483937 RepID=A0A132TY67_9BACL|nr:hypothetical protein [Paenibacillus riograndensis]KWX76184.1 hypothetical protein AMQ84_15940 [Paenibacillus riograndensis]